MGTKTFWLPTIFNISSYRCQRELKLFGYQHSLKYICMEVNGNYLFYVLQKKTSQRFRKPWGWVNNDSIFIFGWTIPLSIARLIELHGATFIQWYNQPVYKDTHELYAPINTYILGKDVLSWFLGDFRFRFSRDPSLTSLWERIAVGYGMRAAPLTVPETMRRYNRNTWASCVCVCFPWLPAFFRVGLREGLEGSRDAQGLFNSQ